MPTAFADLFGIAWNIISNILLAIAIGFFAFAAYYITRFITKYSKKQKAFNIQAIIVDLNGVIDFDWLAFTKSEESGLLEMQFKTRKTDSIPPISKHLIRNGYCLLLNYAPGHYCVIDTYETLLQLTQGINKIIPYNLGMKKYITSKHREILNKIEAKKRWWENYMTWIVMGVAIVIACLLAFALFYVGAWIDGANITQRMAECLAGN